ncbi:MAG: sugar kinase [Deltaproteobacteria bacterium]|nr:sugar kinase [Deltaproteobacteria bacterium]
MGKIRECRFENGAGKGASNFDVYGIGQCSLDYVGRVDTYPPADTKCELSEMIIQGGGPVATALVALARWGIACSFAGVVGDDRFGNIIKSSLEDEGIDISGLRVRRGFESQCAFIMAEPGVGRRTIFWRRPTGPALSAEEIDYASIRSARIVHTDGLFIEASLCACREAREAGVLVVVDAGSFREGMVELGRMSDCFLASETFARDFVGEDKPLDACRKLAEICPGTVGVTLGKRGAVVMDKMRIINRPAYSVEAVDTTGCGDVFHGGFIYGLLQDWSLEGCMDFAAWAASMVSMKLGGRTGIPSIAEWQRLATKK